MTDGLDLRQSRLTTGTVLVDCGDSHRTYCPKNLFYICLAELLSPKYVADPVQLYLDMLSRIWLGRHLFQVAPRPIFEMRMNVRQPDRRQGNLEVALRAVFVASPVQRDDWFVPKSEIVWACALHAHFVQCTCLSAHE